MWRNDCVTFLHKSRYYMRHVASKPRVRHITTWATFPHEAHYHRSDITAMVILLHESRFYHVSSSLRQDPNLPPHTAPIATGVPAREPTRESHYYTSHRIIYVTWLYTSNYNTRRVILCVTVFALAPIAISVSVRETQQVSYITTRVTELLTSRLYMSHITTYGIRAGTHCHQWRLWVPMSDGKGCRYIHTHCQCMCRIHTCIPIHTCGYIHTCRSIDVSGT